MGSYIDQQFATYSTTIDITPTYNSYFIIPGSNDIISTHAPEKLQYGCLYDTQGNVNCTPWQISMDGYSFVPSPLPLHKISNSNLNVLPEARRQKYDPIY